MISDHARQTFHCFIHFQRDQTKTHNRNIPFAQRKYMQTKPCNYKPSFSLFFLLLLSLFSSSITSAYKIQYISLFNVQPLLFFIFFFCFAIFAPISCCCYCYCLFLQILLSIIAAAIHIHTQTYFYHFFPSIFINFHLHNLNSFCFRYRKSYNFPQKMCFLTCIER